MIAALQHAICVLLLIFSPLQALLFGTDKPYNVALLVPDWTLLEEWASQKTDLLPEQRADKQQLAHTTAVRNLIEGEVSAVQRTRYTYSVRTY
jgi:long-subunit acyl-CoA synthetase (AMP-forming)